ncbi:MAG: vitamin B12 dependent-methionine synthase activation domain-containing protein [Paludibacteraceae bacterium]|nr:5-methyltetrahydrofolate--homocysteine methyltransferase [Prevotellaceae bacterium]
MSYVTVEPSFLGLKTFDSLAMEPVLPYIDWTYFFHAWRMSGSYAGLETLCGCEACKQKWLLNIPKEGRDKAEEAMNLFFDARDMLGVVLREKWFKLNVALYFSKARSTGDEIEFLEDGAVTLSLPLLRQQHVGERSGYCLSLADFISPKHDYIGAFAVTVQGADVKSACYRESGDDYSALLIESVAARLAEASSEWLHLQVRRNLWGYAPHESLSRDEVKASKYQGIRPAVGYPSLPDQSVIFDLDNLLHLERIGVRLTENGAMQPSSTICGLYISHPKSSYFMVGKIGKDQLEEYAEKRGKTAEEMRKWLGGVL